MNERYITPAPLPTEHEREILIILIEECSEVIKRATKLLRFGAEEKQPEHQYTNSQRLGHEIGDLEVMFEMTRKIGLTAFDDVMLGMSEKRKQLAKFMQTEAS